MLLTDILDRLREMLPADKIESSGPAGVDVLDIQTDSRAVTPGCMFVALRGSAVDGHDFLSAAVERGAAVLVVEDASRVPEAAECAVVVLPHTRRALGHMAAKFFGDPLTELELIGITGTNGKTTTTFLLEHILTQNNIATGTIGTVSYRWPGVELDAPNTTPESLVLQRLARRMRDDGVEALIMEVSSHGLVTHRLNGVVFDVAVFTNLTQDHLDFHETMEEYKAAKAKLFFEHLSPKGLAVLGLDDPVGREWFEALNEHRLDAVGYSLQGDRDAIPELCVVGSQYTLDGSIVSMRSGDALLTPMLGAFNVANLLCAWGVASKAFGINASRVNRAMRELVGVPGRLERVAPLESPATFVDYAHTPDALERALETLRPFCKGRLHVVFGCGGDRDRQKRPLMGKIARDRADVAWITSDNPRTEAPLAIIDAIARGCAEDTSPNARSALVRVIPDRALAIAGALAAAAPEDVVLIAGKGHETYQEIATGRVDFDDASHARAALGAAREQRHQVSRATRLIQRFDARTIAGACDARILGDVGAAPFAGVGTDTRALADGALFVALVGERFDAHDFLHNAGAARAAIVSRADADAPAHITKFLVDDTLAAFQSLGAWVFSRASAQTLDRSIALTGSNGKTTTKELVRALWSTIGETFATSGNFNNHIGVPITLCELPVTARHAVIEMGASKPGDIKELIDLAPADVRVITSIGTAHLDGMGSIDGIRATKAEIFDGATAENVLVVPHHERAALIPHDTVASVLSFGGSDSGADVMYEILGVTEQGTRVVVSWGERSLELVSPLQGEHNASNLACALATVWGSGVELAQSSAQAALDALVVPGGRWRKIEVGSFLFLDDAYNANPSSTLASFGAFVAWQASVEHVGKRIAVIGDMLELGESAKTWHEDVARCIVKEEEIDAIVFVGEFADDMVRAAREAGREIEVVGAKDPDGVAAYLRDVSTGVVFLKASRGARLERVIELIQDG